MPVESRLASRTTLDPSEKVVAVLADRSVGAYGGIWGVWERRTAVMFRSIPSSLWRGRWSCCKRPGAKPWWWARSAQLRWSRCFRVCTKVLDKPLTLIIPDSGWEPESKLLSPHRVHPARQLSLSKIADPRDPLSMESDTAYLLFTSGSTGVPKGVAVSQSNAGRVHGVTPRSALVCMAEIVVRQNFDLTFDLSVHDPVYPAGMRGRRFVPMRADTHSGDSGGPRRN